MTPRPHVRYRFLALLVFSLAATLAGCSGDDFQANLHMLLEKQRLAAQLQQSLLAASDAAGKSLLAPSDTEAAVLAKTVKNDLDAGAEQLASLAKLIEKSQNAKELERLKPVEADYRELTATYAALHELVARNTNVRAVRLSRTEAAGALDRLRRALEPLTDGPDCQDAAAALRAVADAQAILLLHPLHIDESTAAGMDALETVMNGLDAKVRAILAALPASTNLAEAQSAYDAFWQVHLTIVALSRENTNVAAVALTMGRKQTLQAKTLADLAALAAVIDEKQFTATR